MNTKETNAILNFKYQMILNNIKSTIKETESFLRTEKRLWSKVAPLDMYKEFKATSKVTLKEIAKLKRIIFEIRFRHATVNAIQELEGIHQEVVEYCETFKKTINELKETKWFAIVR